MLSNPHTYSAHDLQQAQAGDLCEAVEKILTFGVQHVRSCDLCSAKGFLCEICRKDQVNFVAWVYKLWAGWLKCKMKALN